MFFGSSRYRQPDFKEFLLDLIFTGDGAVGLYKKMADGNKSD
ncbi:MAG: hypothetical protein O4805_08510 [Trichodesmium sp. St16_bin2-tuft]|nr:hypothetical protein [Trichodesmium sp. St5_bin2_1]MDE5087184.1 hypothetical protein [Trichodesmium sp. St16_bin2-tuft]